MEKPIQVSREAAKATKGKPLFHPLVGMESFMRSKCNQLVLHAEISAAGTVRIVFAYPRLSILFSNGIISEGVERGARERV